MVTISFSGEFNFKGVMRLVRVVKILILLIPICKSPSLFAQLPNADFSVQANACINERLNITNNSTNSIQFEWDFCEGDLFEQPLALAAGFLATSFNPKDMDIKKFGNNWYAFVTSRSTNSLYKLNYGSNLNNPSPVITDLGNFENLLSGPEPIKIIEEDGNWFGLIVNAGSSSIIRLSFGSNLDNNNPISETAFEGLDVGSNGMDLGISSNGIIAVIANTLTNKLTIINFGNSIQNNPLVSDVITTDAIVGAASIDDITLLFSNGNWFGFLVATGSYTVHRLDFGSNLFSTPSVVNISGPNFIANERPFGIQIKQDKGSFVGVIQTFTGPLYRLDFGPVITNVAPSVVKLGDLGKLSNSVNLELVKEGSSWYGFSIDVSNLTINRIDFSYPCSVNDLSSSFFQPTHISYDLSGMYYISLTAFDQNGYSDYYSTSINVSVLTAPDINFITENFCAGHNVNFNFVNNSNDLVTYSCSFGDTQTSTDPNPTHQYSSPGEYTVSLQVTAENGCHNYVEKNIKIYNPTSSSFTLPTGLICTNNEFTFTNNTVDNFDGNLTYQWYVDNSPEATTRDLKYVFLTNGNKDIKLKTSIPGCSSELVKTLNNVQTGPTVGFDYTGKCENGLTQFTNTSSGDIASYLWDLGNDQTRTTANVNEPYTSFGNYMVSLQTTGTNGCISSTSKPVTIYSNPQPDFSLDLPPFSCSGTTSQFNDLTPGPTDSNLTQWSWSFGDAANGISIIKNPTYTYSLAGSYDVSLKATTNFGCAATKIKTIQIAQSPKPDFNTSAACLNQPTYFTDASGTNNKSWLWKVGNSSYTLQNPTHVFSSVGNFTAQLTVTGKNDCVAVTSKPITVPLPPVLDFTSQNNCAGQATIFKDVTSVSIDPAVLHTWDFAGKGSGSGASTQFTFASPGTYGVKMMVTNQSGCNYALTKNTSIVTAPIADFSLLPESGPPPHVVQFTNASRNATSYLWKFNDLNNSASQLESPSFTYTMLGDFIVDLTASNVQGCVDIKSKIVHVIIPHTEIELVEFTLLHDAKTGSVRPVLSIKNNSNYTLNNFEVVLDIAGGGLVKEKINATILPNTSSSQILNYELLPGNSKLDYLCVELELVDDENLGNNSACISLESNEILFAPYPNPIQTELHLDWIAAMEGSVKVSVFTQMGQLAYQKDIDNVGVGLNQIILDLSKLHSGFYILTFEGAETRKTFPFTILN